MAATAAVDEARRQAHALVDAIRTLGAAYVFPADRAPHEPVARRTRANWWPRAETAAQLVPVKGRGYHGLRRTFATERKGVPLTDVAQPGGWTSVQTLLTCYTHPDDVTMRTALQRRGTLTDRGLVAAAPDVPDSAPAATSRTRTDDVRRRGRSRR